MLAMLEFDPTKRISAEDSLNHPYIHQFHDPSVERQATFKVTDDDETKRRVPSAAKGSRPSLIDDDDKRSTAFYRDQLYAAINQRRGQQSGRSGGREESGTGTPSRGHRHAEHRHGHGGERRGGAGHSGGHGGADHHHHHHHASEREPGHRQRPDSRSANSGRGDTTGGFHHHGAYNGR
jgi:serine/threonine protein kinase